MASGGGVVVAFLGLDSRRDAAFGSCGFPPRPLHL